MLALDRRENTWTRLNRHGYDVRNAGMPAPDEIKKTRLLHPACWHAGAGQKRDSAKAVRYPADVRGKGCVKEK